VLPTFSLLKKFPPFFPRKEKKKKTSPKEKRIDAQKKNEDCKQQSTAGKKKTDESFFSSTRCNKKKGKIPSVAWVMPILARYHSIQLKRTFKNPKKSKKATLHCEVFLP